MIRYAVWIGWRRATLLGVSRQFNATSSLSTAFRDNPALLSESLDKFVEEASSPLSRPTIERKSEAVLKTPVYSHNVKENRNSIVAAAFANLKVENGNKSDKIHSLPIDDSIKVADSIESLLTIAESSNISRRHALSIVSILADWTRERRIKLLEFDADPRFIKLCRLLGRGVPRNVHRSDQYSTGFGDLAMVLGVTGDDEAAKLVAGISLNQMIKVMSTLASKRHRSTPLLRSLAFNIGSCDDILDLKQGADVLYAMAVLNFPDDTLLERTCSNLCIGVTENKKSAVVRSILTSMGHLRYKHTALLDGLSEWVAENISTCRPQDVVALLMTLAVVSHIPSNADQLFSILEKHLSAADLSTPLAWLDVVWSLVVLQRASASDVKSVLVPEFQDKVILSSSETKGIGISTRRKLLNINAAAQLLIPNYEGPFLANEPTLNQIPMSRSREKQTFVAAIFDSLSNLLPSSTYLRTNVDTGMGFLLDGECILDKKLNPIPLSEAETTKTGKRIGVLAWDYADMCRSTRPQPGGHTDLAVRLLQASGYRVLVVPYTEFNPHDKLVSRVQYLEQHLKSLVKER